MLLSSWGTGGRRLQAGRPPDLYYLLLLLSSFLRFLRFFLHSHGELLQFWFREKTGLNAPGTALISGKPKPVAGFSASHRPEWSMRITT